MLLKHYSPINWKILLKVHYHITNDIQIELYRVIVIVFNLYQKNLTILF